MEKLPSLLGSFKYNLMYMLGIPTFFLGFVLLYQPSSLVELLAMGVDKVNFNTTIILCILFGVMLISRVLFVVLYRHLHMTWLKYAAWQLAEIVGMSLFMALYMTLMYHGAMAYFSVVGLCLFYLFIITIYPYVVFGLAIAYVGKEEQVPVDDDSLMRFLDSSKRLKLQIAPSAVLYVEAHENYVQIRYMEGTSVKEYTLRASMKSLEELMRKHGLLRCQRGYYINPQHVKVLRKDKEGLISAELDVPNTKPIPVSPKYYDAVSKWL